MLRLRPEELSPWERRCICNGVGPKGYAGLRRIVPQLGLQREGDQHDLDYAQWSPLSLIGLAPSLALKAAADLLFLAAGLERVWLANRGLRRPAMVLVVLFEFLCVVAGGWWAFYGRGSRDGKRLILARLQGDPR